MGDTFADQLKQRLCEVKSHTSIDAATVFVISSTVKSEPAGFYFTPIRLAGNIVLTGVVISDSDYLKDVQHLLDKFDYIFIDQEKKIFSDVGERVNIEADLRGFSIPPRKVRYFKANDLSVDSACDVIFKHYDDKSMYWGGRRVVIVGAGNIGSKIAIKLVECGIDCFLYRRNKKALKDVINGINTIKPIATIARAVALEDLDAIKEICPDIIIGCASSPVKIDPDVLTADTLCLDLGKGSFVPEVVSAAINLNASMVRVSVEDRLLDFVKNHLSRSSKTPKRRICDDQAFVSGGYFGSLGDLVVDDADDPKIIYGVADGCGDFLTREVSKIRLPRDK